MTQTNPLVNIPNSIKISAYFGMLGSLIGSILFGFFSELWLIANPEFTFEIIDVILFSIFSFVLTIIPATVGGTILGRKVIKGKISGKYSVLRTVFLGALIGVVVSLLIIVFVRFFLVRKISYSPLLRYSIVGMIDGFIIGGLTGYFLSKNINIQK